MISLADREALLAAHSLPLPADLKAILHDIVSHAAETDLLDPTSVAIFEQADTDQALVAELGFSPLTNPMDGIRWDQPGVHPYWAYLRLRRGWYELTHAIGTGFPFILLIDAAADTDFVAMGEHFIAVPL